MGAELLSRVNGISKGIGADNDGAPYVSETYAAIPDELVDVEIVQTPYGEYKGYDAPAAKQDPAVYRTGNVTTADVDYSEHVERSTYTSVNASTGTASVLGEGADTVVGGKIVADKAKMTGAAYTQSSQPWVLKITVKQDLGKWFGRAVDNAANGTDLDPVSMKECYTEGGYKMRVNLRQQRGRGLVRPRAHGPVGRSGQHRQCGRRHGRHGGR